MPVDQYSRFGVGLYRVTAVTTGPSGSCQAQALVRVEGGPIPGTAAGDAAALPSALGLAGFGASAGKAVSDGGDPGGDGGPGQVKEEIPTPLLPPDDDWCYPFFVIALLMTVGVMAGGGAPSATPPGPRLRRARWRPRIAGGTIVSCVVGAIGVLGLLQQYGRLYPTGTVVVRAAVAAVAVGLIVPSLLRIIPARRYNRRVAARERALRAGGG
jgi:hypothetical protein